MCASGAGAVVDFTPVEPQLSDLVLDTLVGSLVGDEPGCVGFDQLESSLSIEQLGSVCETVGLASNKSDLLQTYRSLPRSPTAAPELPDLRKSSAEGQQLLEDMSNSLCPIFTDFKQRPIEASTWPWSWAKCAKRCFLRSTESRCAMTLLAGSKHRPRP